MSKCHIVGNHMTPLKYLFMISCFVQVAEMHGELMEFNELLHRQLNAKEHMLKRLQGELVDLRGPVSTIRV